MKGNGESGGSGPGGSTARILAEAPVVVAVPESLLDGDSRRGGYIFGLLALVLAAVSAGLAFWLAPRGFVGRFDDEALYAASAVALAQGRGYAYLFGPEAAAASGFPPLFPLLLAPAVWLGGGAIGAVAGWMQLITALTTGAFVLAVYAALRRALGLAPAVALAAVGALALHPALARYGGAVMADTLAGALALGAIALVARSDRGAGSAGLGAPGTAGVRQTATRAPGTEWVFKGLRARFMGVRSANAPCGAVSPAPWSLARAWAPVCLILALAILTRYAAGLAALALVVALATQRRWRETLTVGLATGTLLLPWGIWAVLHRAADYGQQAQTFRLDGLPGAVWHGLGHVLPGMLIPQVFMAGYPLGAEAAGAIGKWPGWAIAVWGLVVSATLLAPVWALCRSRDLPERTAGLYALFVLGGVLVWSAGFAGMGWDLAARLLLPAVPIFLAGIWRWKAGEHRFERIAAERFKAMVALGWLAAVCLFSPVALRPVAEDTRRFEAFLPERWALVAAVRQFARETDIVATMRPASLWLYADRKAVPLPLFARDLAAAVRATGARFVVGEPFFVGGNDAVAEAFDAASALDPDWVKPVWTSPERRLSLFEVTQRSREILAEGGRD